MIERVPSEDFGGSEPADEPLAMMRQLILESVEAETNRNEGEIDSAGVLLVDASSLEEDDSGTLIGVKQARLESTDAILFCETEIEGGSARYHRATSERAADELTVICRLDGRVLIVNAGEGGISELGEGAALQGP